MKSFTLFLSLLFSFNGNTLNAAEIDVYDLASSLKGNLKDGKNSYRLCASCHLENGWGKINGSFPVIAGQHKSVIIKQLKDIQYSDRANPTMSPFSDAETIGGAQAISNVASYINQLTDNPNNGIGSGKDLAIGETLYKANCIACHGEKGQGNAQALFPKISNQHYKYLLRQLIWIKTEYRTNSNVTMLSLVKKISDEDLEKLADYISRL